MNSMVVDRLRTLYTRANAMKSTYDSLPGSSANDYKTLLDELDSIIKLCEAPIIQGPIDSHVDEVIQAHYPHGGCPDIIRELAYAAFEAGIIYEADGCYKLEKEWKEADFWAWAWKNTCEMQDKVLSSQGDRMAELEKELEFCKVKEKEWLKTFSEMKARLMGCECRHALGCEHREMGKKLVIPVEK